MKTQTDGHGIAGVVRGRTPRQEGYAILLVLFFSGVALLALAGVMDWTKTNGTLIYRDNQYYRSSGAAEAATEKVLTRMARDYKNQGEATVYSSIGTYSDLVPTTAESAAWGDFAFSDALGHNNRTYIGRTATTAYVPLASQYSGLFGFASTYRVISNVRESSSRFAFSSAVQQDVQLASIPIFQFAIFYSGDMELNGAATLNVRGRVHGNSHLYTGSTANQTFFSDVTVSGIVSNGARYGWTLGGTVTYSGQKDTNVGTLSLPIGTNNTPGAVREVLYTPPAGEDLASAMARERYYNKANLILLVSNSTVTVGLKNPYDATYTSVPWLACTNFVSTNKSFTDQREGKTIATTEIDVAKFTTWATTNSSVIAKFGAGNIPNLIYAADFRTETGSKIDGIRLVNGQTLPTSGLTVATPNPLYTLGHYNQPNAGYLGTTNTSNTKPASLVSDAYTLLSSSFTDGASSASYTTRNPGDTTVVAAVVTGNVPSAGTYSGGVNNLPRLLENWTGHTFTLNGSLVCLYNSAKATAPFQNPGVYYSAPTRNINFDPNFYDPARLPPGTPTLRTLVRSKWSTPPPGSTTYAAY